MDNAHITLLRFQADEDAHSLSASLCVTPSTLRVTKQLGHRLLTLRPTLAEHACYACGVRRFGEVICGSSLPHLVEHLAIDLLVEAYPGQGFSGTTAWEDDEAGIMCVCIRRGDNASRKRRVADPPDHEQADFCATMPDKAALETAIHHAVSQLNDELAKKS